MREAHFWIGVASREHVQHGAAQGIAQLNHGKREGLARIRQDDWIIYYSPRTSYPSGAPLQAFTAIGQIVSETPYQVTMSDDFRPFRHDVHYFDCREVPISEVLTNLSFLPDKQRWGARFRFGQLSIPEADFYRIAEAMGVHIPAPH
jgi:hypothetical protein